MKYYKYYYFIYLFYSCLINCFITTLWNEEGMKDIYDIVLENEDPYQNYGIWVNGILTETMDEDFFLNYSGMIEINK